MLTKVCCVVLVVVVLQAAGSPPRVKRQGFNWGDDDQNIRPTSSQPPTPAPGGDTTTTTASPEFTACMRRCPRLPQYNPVCGTNRITYNNQNHLNCAASCGIGVQVAFGGSCSPL